MISLEEWERIIGSDIAPIRLIRVPRVPRIRQERALFIETAYPELLDEYVPFSVFFRQRSGLVFEDASRDVTRDFIYPPDDAVRAVIRTWAKAIEPSRSWVWPMKIQPPREGPTMHGPELYRAIVMHHLKLRSADVSVPLKSVLDAIAVFHSRARASLGRRAVSLHSLQDAADRAIQAVGQGSTLDLRMLIDPYRTKAPPAMDAALGRLAEDVSRAWSRDELWKMSI